ncbi:MAG: Fe-S cluster assembly ATPase SufC [Lentisphaerae bacterium]|nr:MAG: Fe-S cluster assembly ATPase SufC [Lentisphaerota bacterium]
MLVIENLHVQVEGKEIIHGIDLEIRKGQTHAIMGPNGSGKSTLAYVIAGRPGYEITQGRIVFQGKEIQELSPTERARAGLFLGFQYPVEIPGVSNTYFLKNALNAIRKERGLEPLDAIEFMSHLKKKLKLLDLAQDLLQRPVNTGFSGGEKKRNEIFQLLVLEPALAVLDETDSGLDIDSLRMVSKGVNAYRNEDNALLLITHYQRLLDYIKPDFIHVLMDGRLVHSGGPELAHELEAQGYEWLRQREAESK